MEARILHLSSGIPILCLRFRFVSSSFFPIFILGYDLNFPEFESISGDAFLDEFMIGRI